ncbi:MAG TPA: MarR family transcriptional regulator [Candidatus Limnocylindrales bacterium]|nr:MarR family transcriptional regulator [Candidatus Limnocylindrales bacterium]
MPTDPAARDAAELMDLMYGVMRRIWEHAERRLAPQALSLKHYWALHALDEPMSMGALGERLGIDASYVTTIADQLEERGLIERRPHPTDRRIKSLALTPEGRRTRERLVDQLWTDVHVLEALTQGERAELRRLLAKAQVAPAARAATVEHAGSTSG